MATAPNVIATAASGGELDVQKRKDIAKARRAVASQGKGGLRIRSGAKRTEQMAPSKGRGFGLTPRSLNYDRLPKPDAACECGSGEAYGRCCAVYHGAGSVTASPETLVRARFTAFRYRLPDFLMQTTDPQGSEWDSDPAAWKRSLLGFCDDFEFQKLHVLETTMAAGDKAQVKFKVDFCQKGTLNLMTLCETSTFKQEPTTGRWLYVRGDVSYEAQG